MKKIILLFVSMLWLTCTSITAAPASASTTSTTKQSDWKVNRGFYLGAEFGVSFVNYKPDLFTAQQAAQIISIKNHGFSEHITAGLIFSPYLAGELTVNYITKPVFTFQGGGLSKFRNNIVALLLRASWPIQPRLLLMAKGGLGYVAREGLKNPATGQHYLSDNEYFRPVYGLGLDYRLTKHWDITTSWQQAAPLSSATLPATNFIGAGMYYRWK